MIKAFYQDDIAKRLGAILTYGLKGKYSCKAIEERIVASPLVAGLERNYYDPSASVEKAVEDAFDIKLNEEADISFRALFAAESYLRLFFALRRSFEYLFLYWGLETVLDKYEIYHEMDFSSLKEDFLSLTKKTPLLRKLSLSRHFKLTDVAFLTGISKNTVNKYAQDDRFLYSCSQENAYRLAWLFNTKESLFLPDILVYLDTSVYLSDDSYRDCRNFLGFFYASFFDKRINDKDFSYDVASGLFLSSDLLMKVMVCEADKMKKASLDGQTDERTYLVIFPCNILKDDPASWAELKEAKAYEVFIVGLESVFLLKKGERKDLSETLRRALICKAKEKAGLLGKR